MSDTTTLAFQYTATDTLTETNGKIPIEDAKIDEKPHEYRYIWKFVIIYVLVHISSLYAVYLAFSSAKLLTTIQAIILAHLGVLGITCGSHRLWAHKSYRAKTPLKIILAIMVTLAFQFSTIVWSRDHRVHHKYSETVADPHNATRGFFHAHAGWYLTKRHPSVKAKVKSVDVSDLTSDPILNFQDRHYIPLVIFISFFLPTVLPMYLWGETFENAWYLNVLRYCLTSNYISLVNSAAHLYGNKPYDKSIYPANNVTVALLASGEGWHNYHHAFPWDYKNSELGMYSLNFSAAFIDLFAKIGWAYDLKVASDEIIKKRVLRTGDGSHQVWGCQNKDVLKEDIQKAVITKDN